MEEGIDGIKRLIRENLERAGLDREIIILLEEAAEITEDLKTRGFTHLNSQSFRLGILLTKISVRMKGGG